MQVKEILDKLEVPIHILRLIGAKVNVNIKDEKQDLLPFQVTKLQKIVLQDEFSKLVTNLQEKYNKALQNAYLDGTNHYFIGSIKWFSDTDESKNYGFAHINDIGDVYFKRKHIFNSNPEEFIEDEIVLIRIEEKKILLSENLSASRINFIKDEDNISFLLHLKINKQLPNSQKGLLDLMLTEKLVNLDKNQRLLLGIFIDTIPSEKFALEQLDFYRNLYSLAEKELFGSQFLEGLQRIEKLELWLKDDNLIKYSDIKEELAEMVSSRLEKWNSLQVQELEIREELFKIALVRLNEKDSSINEYLTLYSNAQKCEVTLSYRETPTNVLFELWKHEDYDIPVNLVQDQLADKLYDPNTSLPAALRNESKEDQQQVLEYAFDKLLKESKGIEEQDYPLLKTLFSNAHNLEIPLSTEKIEDNIAHLLWRDQFSDRVIISELYMEYWNFFKGAHGENDVDNITVLGVQFAEDLERLSEDETSNMLAAHFYDLETIGQQDYKFFKALLEFDLAEIHRSNFIHAFEKKSDSYGKLCLFVDDYIQKLDFDEAVLYTGLLNSDEQKLFFKKCLSLVEREEVTLTLADFNRILVTDYKLYAQAKSIGDYELDFSLAMVLHIASQVEKGKKVNQQSIFEIVAELINNPKELLKITGFFDECHGRYSLKKTQNTEPQEYELTNYDNSNPRFAIYCEGRKAIDKNSGQPTLCDKINTEFFWCENSRCYDIARKEHCNDEWKNYSLADVLRIMNISFSEKQYEQLVGTINKANNFFEHLNCRDCDSILHPSGMDNYGIYRVSNFCCKNPDCNNNENIYLSHCANGRCLDIVDSRDSALCKTDESGDACGWYVCNNCHACCTTRNIQARAYRLAQMNQDNQCPSEGHWDRQKLCCNECGTEMKEQNTNYDAVLKWLLDQKNTHPCITKNGVNQFGKHWFVWQQGRFTHEKYRETIINFRKSGFNIPDFEDENRHSYLIAEPRNKKTIGTYYKCPKCPKELIISSDILPLDQYSAIIKYHFERDI